MTDTTTHPLQHGYELAQAIRTGDLQAVAEALVDGRGLEADPIDFALTLVRALDRQAPASVIVDYFDHPAEVGQCRGYDG